ncbi:hypothetical protein P168DRAFT_345063 [Aspergillus campestris IBT 28561]|uniref:Nephrocystin 3-like N-terminal domain-containing protein n=1 Tax=Aspergillus campestris (strain IBT 28561) TaxID=1392248 RepID=A0A2I1D1T5_ASPC2|nr:uncharacterized protein P168DRAFT_345063 [Aspergillus campestris IBT 28561]PKY03829.1 hypothetical protein P168DRAFT_345063 [Aspergillus campestris IBT 28561]
MASHRITRLGLQPPTVDFIDNELPDYHPIFVNPPARYDPTSGKYIPNDQMLTPQSASISRTVRSSVSPKSHCVAPRPALNDPQTFQFWNDVFPEAMYRLRSGDREPKGLVETAYSIRGQKHWEAVYEILRSARDKYDQGGLVRRARRKVADHIGPVAEATNIASQVAPGSTYSTPVLGSLKVLLGAVKTAASVRSEVLGSLENLIPTFSTAELFLGIFRNDANIREASIQLTISTLVAIERAIVFFIRHEVRKAGNAIFQGADYEKGLLDSLQMINTKATGLAGEAQKSHIYQSHLGKHITANHYALLKAENVRLRSTSPFEPASWVPSTQTQTPITNVHLSQEALSRILNVSDFDISDIDFVIAKKGLLPAKQRAQVEQAVNTQHFQQWIVSPFSAKLLIHWDFQLPETISGISPLSSLCVSLAQGLGAHDQFMCAVFFCGRHTDATDAGDYIGGRAMLTSLIRQLLRQCEFDTRSLSQQVHVPSLQQDRLDELITLLVCIVRQVPKSTTLFFIIDGVSLFEREEFQDGALGVLSTLLGLVRDPVVFATLKVLFTSTPGTEIVRAAFEPDDLVLDISGLPQSEWEPREERMMRELEGRFD